MLEKTLGVTLVTKLRAILLMETDFNATNKIVYGNRMMAKAREKALMPEEIFSERNRKADNGTLSKTPFCNLPRQARAPVAIASIDVRPCIRKSPVLELAMPVSELAGIFSKF
jgi:hypothetical protein